MKLYTRLVDAGVFTFWSSDGDDTSFHLKIKILVGDNKITLVDLTPPKGQNYFTFDRVGSGDYEIELNAYRGGKLYQTETKSIKIISSVQRPEELLQMLNSIRIDVFDIREALTEPREIFRIQDKVEEYRRRFR